MDVTQREVLVRVAEALEPFKRLKEKYWALVMFPDEFCLLGRISDLITLALSDGYSYADLAEQLEKVEGCARDILNNFDPTEGLDDEGTIRLQLMQNMLADMSDCHV